MPGPLLIDVECLCDDHTDDALEGIYKAMSEDLPGGSIWDEHPNPFVRRIVERFTQAGLDRIAEVQAEFAHWLGGERFIEGLMRRPSPSGMVERWGESELTMVRLYLSSLQPAQFQLDDWMLLVDYLFHRYMPADQLIAEASWLVRRSEIMGRVQARIAEPSEEAVDQFLQLLPENPPPPPIDPVQRAAVEFARVRCCEHVTALSEGGRTRMRKLIVDWQEASFLGDAAAASESLQSKLLDEFGALNRDWRRIAVTEATENVNQGFVAAAGPGAKLRRVELYRGACAWCRSIDGVIVTVVDPKAKRKNGDTEIWVGKTNVGRSASPRKRVNGALVDRDPSERWWIASGAQHPHCRGKWVKAAKLADDPDFEAWLANLKGKPK